LRVEQLRVEQLRVEQLRVEQSQFEQFTPTLRFHLANHFFQN
jgi:hypothetical protein